MIYDDLTVTWWNWKRRLVSWDDIFVFVVSGAFVGFVAGFLVGIICF